MKANQFRAMMLVLLMAVVSLGVVNAQTLTVTGTVTDVADGTPIVGCSVMLKGTTKGTVTNVNGQYAIQAKKGETLLFQFIGYKQESRVVTDKSVLVPAKLLNDLSEFFLAFIKICDIFIIFLIGCKLF